MSSQGNHKRSESHHRGSSSSQPASHGSPRRSDKQHSPKQGSKDHRLGTNTSGNHNVRSPADREDYNPLKPFSSRSHVPRNWDAPSTRARSSTECGVGESSALVQVPSLQPLSRPIPIVRTPKHVVSDTTSGVARGSSAGAAIAKPKYPCPHCSFSTTEKSTYRSHLNNRHHGGGPSLKADFECDLCGSSFSSKKSMKEHITAKHTATRFPCPHCPSSFKWKTACCKHIREKHSRSQGS